MFAHITTNLRIFTNIRIKQLLTVTIITPIKNFYYLSPIFSSK